MSCFKQIALPNPDQLLTIVSLTTLLCSMSQIGCENQAHQNGRNQAIDQGIDLDLDQRDVMPYDATLPSEDMSEERMIDEGSPSSEGLDLGNLPEELPPPWDPPLGETPGTFKVRVLLDQRPLPGAMLTQGGSHLSWESDENGEQWLTIDPQAIEPITIFAASSLARTKGSTVSSSQQEGITISLTSFNPLDQPDYPYADPGEPERRGTTAQCGHCHLDINDAWFASPHRSSAKNPIVHDLYTGRGSGHRDETSCLNAGGRWAIGPREGGASPTEQCYFEISALSTFNPSCEAPCTPSNLGDDAYFGACADCHAPAVNGLEGGGHDLLSVTGNAFEYGISCDLCHHVEKVRQDEAAGVAGRLVILRPRERGAPSLGGGGFKPLSFGPHADISNPRMGISPREHFQDGSLCGGCHQHQHRAEHNAPSIDLERWPEGEIPNQSTYQEWQEGPLGGEFDHTEGKPVACNSCHMPPNPLLMNSANLEYFTDSEIGIQGGWPRPYGETRAHAWWGPRQPNSPILQLSGYLSLSPLTIERSDLNTNSTLSVSASVSNLGAGHGLPSGEPMRHMILAVYAECGEQDLEAVGGDVIHEIGGALDTRSWSDAQLAWPKAQVGDILRIVRVSSSTPYDYDGYGKFRDHRYDTERGINASTPFPIAERGLPKTEAIGSVTVTERGSNGLLTFSEALPGQVGDVVYLHRPTDTPRSFAGQAGFTFARVLSGEMGPLMLPHFVAQDLLRDNRLRPNATWRTQHRFSIPNDCTSPTVTAELIYRPYPRWLAIERAWTMWDRVIRRVSRNLESLPPQAFPYTVSISDPLEPQIKAPLPPEVSLSPAQLNMKAFRVYLDREEAERSTRRQEAWPWRMAEIDLETGLEVDTNIDELNVINLQGSMVIFNESDQPLALEPIPGIKVYGVSIDESPTPNRVLRVEVSNSDALWIIPPQSGASLFPQLPLDQSVLLAAGYSEHGGRSWTPPTALGILNLSESELVPIALRESIPPKIQREALSEEEERTLGEVELAISYQGSPRADRWFVAHTPLILRINADEQSASALLSVRNMSATGQSFSISGQLHQRWISGQGWSDPVSVSWLAIQSEALIRLPRLNRAVYRLGSVERERLGINLSVD